MLKRVGERIHSCLTLTVVMNLSFCAAIPLKCTYSIVVQVLSGANYICNEVVLPHGGPKGYISYPVKCIFEICEDMVQLLLMLKVLFTQELIDAAHKLRS